jgi:hypothetical protein
VWHAHRELDVVAERRRIRADVALRPVMVWEVEGQLR